MKAKVATLTIIAMVFGMVATQSSEARRLPGVGPTYAKQRTFAVLRQLPIWRYRSLGFVDCSRGKINRTTWSCRYLIVKHHTCWRGRSQTFSYWNNYQQAFYFHTSVRTGNRYHCIGVDY